MKSGIQLFCLTDDLANDMKLYKLASSESYLSTPSEKTCSTLFQSNSLITTRLTYRSMSSLVPTGLLPDSSWRSALRALNLTSGELSLMQPARIQTILSVLEVWPVISLAPYCQINFSKQRATWLRRIGCLVSA